MTQVLIVDDKEENLYYLEALLTAHGCTVMSARHGAEALFKARAAPPDLIISDLLMPVMDGYTLLRHWKASAQLRHIPFIVYTATYTEEADEKLARDLGADAFILKPAEPDDFLARVQQVQANTVAALPLSANQPLGDENAMLEVYSQTLIRKLEEKSLQLEESNAALRLDILARKQAEATLAMASRLGRLGAWVISLPSQQTTWSEEARAIHEVPSDFLPTIEKSIAFYAPECRPTLSKAFEACVQNGLPFDLELQLITSTGRHVAVRTMGEAVRDSQGKVLQIQGAIQDITDRKLLEDKVRQAQKMEAVGTLASGIAHDFNNIIAVIQGNIHKALDDLHPEHPSRKNVNEIRKATHHAKNLVKQILTFSRQQPPVHQLMAVGPVLEETAGFLQASLPPGISLVYSVAQGTPHIQADATQLHQVLLNLCTNAAHAIGEQPGRIDLKAEAVLLDAAQAGAPGDLNPGLHLQLTVSDTGTGMDEATIERIFNPFFTTKEPGKGTGLGLSVVDGIIREHKGRISVTSQPGQGTTFTILIPASEDQTAAPADETDTSTETQRGSGQRILYLDDKEDLVELSTTLFESLGYQVTGFTSPASCIQAFTQNPDGFDLFITDLNMPGHSGLDVAAQLLALQPKLGVILVSGYTDDKLTEKAHQMGIKHVVSKTSSLETMANTIHELLLG